MNNVIGDKPPRVDLSRFPKSVTVKAGRPLELEISYNAFPLPAMIWSKDGKVIQSEDNSQCKTIIDPKKCKLTMYDN